MDSTHGHFVTKRSRAHPPSSVVGQKASACTSNAVRRSSQDLRAEECTPADDLACGHERALARIVQCLRMLRHGRHMRPHHLKNEEVVLVDEHVVIQPTFEARMTLPDQWHSNVMSFGRGQAEGCEFVDLPPRGVTDPDDL